MITKKKNRFFSPRIREYIQVNKHAHAYPSLYICTGNRGFPHQYTEKSVR